MLTNEYCIVCHLAAKSDLEKASSESNHTDVCKECLGKHIETQCNTKASLRINCPKALCRKELGYHDVKKLVPKQLFERYDGLLLRHVIRALKDFRWCTVAKCGWGQEHTTEVSRGVWMRI